LQPLALGLVDGLVELPRSWTSTLEPVVQRLSLRLCCNLDDVYYYTEIRVMTWSFLGADSQVRIWFCERKNATVLDVTECDALS
jgi:hypothetical protein